MNDAADTLPNTEYECLLETVLDTLNLLPLFASVYEDLFIACYRQINEGILFLHGGFP